MKRLGEVLHVPMAAVGYPSLFDGGLIEAGYRTDGRNRGGLAYPSLFDGGLIEARLLLRQIGKGSAIPRCLTGASLKRSLDLFGEIRRLLSLVV